MAQWKRAGPITQRSEDQNLALLVIVVLPITMFKVCFTAYFYLFCINQFKGKSCNWRQTHEIALNENIGRQLSEGNDTPCSRITLWRYLFSRMRKQVFDATCFFLCLIFSLYETKTSDYFCDISTPMEVLKVSCARTWLLANSQKILFAKPK